MENAFDDSNIFRILNSLVEILYLVKFSNNKSLDRWKSKIHYDNLKKCQNYDLTP